MSFQSLLLTLRADIRPDTERGKLVYSAAIMAALKVGSILIAFPASLLYARALGPYDYGLYAYVIAWVTLFTIVVNLGLPTYLVREGAKVPGSLHWLRRWADRRVLLCGLAMGAFMVCAYFIPYVAGARWLFVMAAPLPLLNSLGSVRQALLQARGWVVRSQWPILILGPAVMLIVLVFLWIWQGRLYPIELIATMVGAAFLQLLVNEIQLRCAAPRSEIPPLFSVRLRAALVFMGLGGLYLLNSRVDLIMLGSLRGAHDAGIYAVVVRAAEFISFFIFASNMVLAPRIAHLHYLGEYILLQRVITGAIRRVFILSLPIVLFFILAAYPLLDNLYGNAYVKGAVALQILALAQLINIFAGPTATVLDMTGHEKLTAIGIGVSAATNIVLNATLVPLFGITGAACATGASLVLWNVLLWYWIRIHVGLCSSVLGY